MMTNTEKIARRIRSANGNISIGCVPAVVSDVFPLTVVVGTLSITSPKLHNVGSASFAVGDTVLVCSSNDNQQFYVLGGLTDV